MTLLPGTPDIDAALDLGCSVYLLIHAPETPAVVDAIQARRPDARILIRRYGGVDDGRSVADQIAAWYPMYAVRGVTDILPWNEGDRVAEGGWPYETIAARFAELVPLVRDLCPDIRLHWPALSEEAGYAEIGKWKDAAALADAVDGHWYRDADGIDALGRFFESHFPGKEWFVTEYSSRGLNAPPPRLGVEQDAYEACRKAHLWPLCRGVLFFAWRWPGAEPGGEVEEIANDPETLAALHRAVMDFHAPEPIPPEPEPEPERTMQTGIYLHQFGGDGRAYRETSYREFARTAKDYGIQQIWFKAFQGGHYATWDPGALALNSLGRIQRCYEECAAEGVEAVFWGVPQGGTWRADAAICKSIGAVAGGKIHIDLEGFKDFWNTPAYGSTGMPPFYQMLKDADLYVATSAVMRFGEPASFPWEELIDLTDEVWTQSYFTDFREPAVNVVRDDLNTALALGIPLEKLGVVLPHNGVRADLDAALEAIQALNVGRVAIWVWDWAGLTPFEFLRDMGASPPEPAVDHWREMHAAFSRGADISQPGVLVLPDGTDISDEGVVLAEVGRILQIVGRHRAALAGE